MVKQSKWRILIADDEPAARRGVRQLLAAFPQFAVAGECRNGAEVLAALDVSAPDVVFLDIQMPGIDGFEVIRRRTAERMPAVVFLTAFDQFAIRAFEAEALDYLVKPVSEARFSATMKRLIKRLRSTQHSMRDGALSSLPLVARRCYTQVKLIGSKPRAITRNYGSARAVTFFASRFNYWRNVCASMASFAYIDAH